MRKKYILTFIWSLSLLFYLYQYVARASVPNVLNDKLMEYFGIDATSVCALFSAFYMIYMFMQIPVGYLLDRFGTKYIAFCSVLSCSIGLSVFISTRSYYIAMFGQLLVGIGSSFAFILSLKLAEEMFSAKRIPMISAILNSSGAFGAFFISPAVAKMSVHFSITTIIYGMSFFGVILAFMLLSFIRHNIHPPKMSVLDMLEKIKRIFSNRQILLISFNSMLMYSIVVVFADHFGVSYMRAAFGVSILDASWMCSMIYIGVILGSPIFASIANYTKSYKIALASGSALTMIVLCILVFARINTANASIFMFLLGLCVSSQVMSFPAAMSIVNRNMTGTASSIVNTITTLSGVVIYPAVGFIMDHVRAPGAVGSYTLHDFQCGFSLLILTTAISMTLTIFIRNSYKRVDVPVDEVA